MMMRKEFVTSLCCAAVSAGFVLLVSTRTTVQAGAGGTAAIDMMLERIARRQGPTLARAVSEQFIHSRIRPHEERQRADLAVRIGTRDPRLIAVIAQMEAEIENPLRLEDMAASAGITRRQLERLFMAQFGEGPAAYYRNIRLERARSFLADTSLPLIEVAVATGFASKSALARAYVQKFGRPPGAERGRWKLPAPSRAAKTDVLPDPQERMP